MAERTAHAGQRGARQDCVRSEIRRMVAESGLIEHSGGGAEFDRAARWRRPLPAGPQDSTAQSRSSVDDHPSPDEKRRAEPPRATRPKTSWSCSCNEVRRLSVRLLLLSVLRLRRLSARLLLPTPSARGLHSRPERPPRRSDYMPAPPVRRAFRRVRPRCGDLPRGRHATRSSVGDAAARRGRAGRTARSRQTARRCQACGYLPSRGSGHRRLRALRPSSSATPRELLRLTTGAAPSDATGSPPTRRSAGGGFELQTALPLRPARRRARPGSTRGHDDKRWPPSSAWPTATPATVRIDNVGRQRRRRKTRGAGLPDRDVTTRSAGSRSENEKGRGRDPEEESLEERRRVQEHSRRGSSRTWKTAGTSS